MLSTFLDLLITQERPIGPETYPLRFLKAVINGKNPFDPELYKIPDLDKMNKETMKELKNVINDLLDEEKGANKEKTIFTPKLEIENVKDIFDMSEADVKGYDDKGDFSEYLTNNHNYRYRF